MVKGEEREEIEYKGHLYKLRDFASQGYPFKLLGYDWFLGVHDIFYDQYGLVESGLTEGSVIIDAGAFVGDTAVLFNHHLGGHCQVHCFELLDENLALLECNACLNSVPDGVIHLNKFALTDKTGGVIAIKTGSTQGSTSIFGHPDRGELAGC